MFMQLNPVISTYSDHRAPHSDTIVTIAPRIEGRGRSGHRGGGCAFPRHRCHVHPAPGGRTRRLGTALWGMQPR
ncbi:hypothetical protein UO65_6461 [Actinokineospora spheciospongiae]|uniref:Uncharacterized protein n=1 Tax=Actinokineospora spheciospongiae TaxID=909613 RepID=W7INC4_9PSEU|nr:hypothetical protein UO65_6461 [Actinokineospora spheciospongiae]